jgi:hypothetical protein
MRIARRHILMSIVVVGLFLCAALRGYLLLGSDVAVVFAVLAAAALYLLWRAFAATRKRSVLSMVVAVAVTVPVGLFMAFPPWFNSDFATFIEGHATERRTKRELRQIVTENEVFADLDVECKFRKCIVVTVRGTLPTKSDLLELRQRIFEHCPDVSSRWLFWEIMVLDSGTKYDDIDLTLFGESRSSRFRHRHV